MMDATTLARIVWMRECEGRTADQVDGTLFMVDGHAQAQRLTCRGYHPAEVIDTLAPLPAEVELVALAAGGTERRFDPETGDTSAPRRIRLATAVSRDGTSVTLQCADGEDGPHVMSDQGGPLHAALVMAMVPAGELDRELTTILEATT